MNSNDDLDAVRGIMFGLLICSVFWAAVALFVFS